MQVATVLTSYTPKTINGQNGPFTIHEFTAADGLVFSTTKQLVANQLHALLNQGVSLEYEEKINGNFTNRHIKSVLGPADAAQVQTPPAGAPAAPPQQAPAAQPPLFSQDETQILIMFQSLGNGAALDLMQLADEQDVQAWAAITKAMIVEAIKFSKESVASVTASGASSPGTGGGEAGAGEASAPAQTDDGIPF